MTIDNNDIARELQLDEGETFLLLALQAMMLDRDLTAEARPSETKTVVRDRTLSEAIDVLENLSGTAPEWIRSYAADHPGTAENIIAAPAELGSRLAGRNRAVLLLIELLLLQPWHDPKARWDGRTRTQSLRAAAVHLSDLRAGDLTVMERECDLVLRKLRRASVKWGRVAAITVVGAVLVGTTAGLAAPAIGGVIGSTAMGLSGAAATSAGLAALGGGSLASGGLGMAGGTALLTGLGGATGAGVAGVSARWVQRGSGQLISDAIKLDLVTRMIYDDDSEKARRVVISLQQRITELAVLTNQLGDRIRELSEDKVRLTAENRELRNQLRRERDEAEIAGTALEIVVDRLSLGKDPVVQ